MKSSALADETIHPSPLCRHVDAAMETVEVATKELKVETRLRNIENRWKEEQLGFTRHRDTEVRPALDHTRNECHRIGNV